MSSNEENYFLSLKMNQSSTLAALYNEDDDGKFIFVYQMISGVSFLKHKIRMDRKCDNFSFLPSAYGSTLAVLCCGSLRLYDLSINSSDSIDIITDYKTVELKYSSDSAKCFKVGCYPPNLYFGYIQDGFLHIYLLDISNNHYESLPFRRYILDNEPFIWYGFADKDVLYTATGRYLRKTSLTQSVFFGDEECVELNDEFIDADISSTNQNMLCLLFKRNENTECALISFDGGSNQLYYLSDEDAIDEPSPKSIQWSTFSTNIIINGKKTHVLHKNVASDKWEILEKEF